MDIYDTLREFGVSYKEFKHPAVWTVKEAEGIDIPGLRTKNLFLQNRKGDRYILVIAEASSKVDLKNLAHVLGEKKLIFASPGSLNHYLGVSPGSVSPFNLIHDKEHAVEVVVDEKVFKAEFAGFHPNTNTSTLVLSSEDLKKFLEESGYNPLIFSSN